MDLWDLEEKYGNNLRFAGIRTPSKSEMKKKANSHSDLGQNETKALPTQISNRLAASDSLASQLTLANPSKLTLAGRPSADKLSPQASEHPAKRQGILSNMVVEELNKKIFVQVFSSTIDCTKTVRRICQDMGATILSRAEFEQATVKKNIKLGKTKTNAVDLVVWSEGEYDVIFQAEQNGIPIVSTAWVQKCQESQKLQSLESFTLSELERLRCFDNMGTTAKKLRRRSDSPEEEKSIIPKKQAKKVKSFII